KSCPGGEFAPGTKVAALMGGLGRTINSSYAEYTRAPGTNVAAIESGLSWADLAAIPETYATAWTWTTPTHSMPLTSAIPAHPPFRMCSSAWLRPNAFWFGLRHLPDDQHVRPAEPRPENRAHEKPSPSIA